METFKKKKRALISIDLWSKDNFQLPKNNFFYNQYDIVFNQHDLILAHTLWSDQWCGLAGILVWLVIPINGQIVISVKSWSHLDSFSFKVIIYIKV